MALALPQPDTIGADADPRTVEEWQAFLARYPSPLVTTKLKAGGGTSHTPGHTLLSVSNRGLATVIPANHKHPVMMSIGAVRLWKKGFALRLATDESRRERDGGRTKFYQLPKAIADQPHYLADTISNRLIIVSKGRGGPRWTKSWINASRFDDLRKAQVSASNQRRRLGSSVAFEYLTVAEAKARFPLVDDRKPEPTAKLVDPPLEAPTPLVQPVIPDESMAIAQAVAQESAKTTAPARSAALLEARAKWEACVREHAQAKTLVADCRGRVAVALAELRIAECTCGR